MAVILKQPGSSVPLCPTQRIVTGGTWNHFQLLRQGFENSRVVRLFYYDGTIEIIMPGRAHELFKRLIGLMIEAFLLDREIEFTPTGSMTQELAEVAAAEADESYEIGDFRLSIEVTVTSGNSSKLKIYQALEVNEVWFWEDGMITMYHLVNGDYVKVDRSLIPELVTIDREVLARCVLIGETSRVQAMKAFRSAHPVLT
ncbi:MAG: Uma2 family endonuclease [Synechococcales bacterium]|nr:Uma2 family endonuclease [Synechococcales bacterium]